MVAVIDGPAGMPALFRIAGLTTMMYDMVVNVVSPARISRRKLLPWASIWKKRRSAFNGRP